MKLTTNDAARRIGVSTSSVMAYERAGKLPATRTASGVRLFDEADVEAFAASRNARRHDADRESNSKARTMMAAG